MFLQFNSPGTGEQNEVAILFVHGFTGDCRGTWGDIPALLEKEPALAKWDLCGFGYQTRRSIDLTRLWSSDASLEQIATMLLSVPEVSAYKRIAWVAHSMGGLVVQKALTKSADLRGRTSHLALFGTPSGGLESAGFFAKLKLQFKDMSASGTFIKELRNDWTTLKLDSAPPFHFIAVAGETDQFVPPDSSLGPFPEAKRAVIPGNHISMLETTQKPAPIVKLLLEVLTKGAAVAGPRNAAALAVEMGQFQKAIDTLWPRRNDLDKDGARLLAIALDQLGRREDAMALLESRGASDTDALGILAGRHKRRWLLEHRQSDIDKAFELYRQAYQTVLSQTPLDHAQGYYHAINIAFLDLATGKVNEAQTMASAVLNHCAQDTTVRDIFWRLASEGDANTILGEKTQALAAHAEAAKLPLQPWQALSIQEQAVRIADLAGWSNAEQLRLTGLYSGASALAQTT